MAKETNFIEMQNERIISLLNNDVVFCLETARSFFYVMKFVKLTTELIHSVAQALFSQ